MICCLFLPCTVLQTCGIFSPYWMQDPHNRECFRGILYSVGCPDYNPGLGPLVTGLQIFAFLFMILSTAGTVFYVFCTNGEDYSCGEKCFHCMFCFYPFAGILGIAGCIIAIHYYSINGWGFYLCLVASCYILLQIFCSPMYADCAEIERNQLLEQYINNNVVNGRVVELGQIELGQMVHQQRRAGAESAGQVMVDRFKVTRISHIS